MRFCTSTPSCSYRGAREKVHPVLENLRTYDLPGPPVPANERPQEAAFLQNCGCAGEYFKNFVKQAVEIAAIHVLSMVRSHYPSVNVEAVAAGYAPGTSETRMEELSTEVAPAAKRLASDVELQTFYP